MDAMRLAMAQGETIAEQQDLALRAAEAFAEEDVEHCRAIGEHGSSPDSRRQPHPHPL